MAYHPSNIPGQSDQPAQQAKWQQVLADIEGKFHNGFYKPDTPFPTLGQLSHIYSVSDITARRVFRELKNRGRIVTRGRHGTFTAPIHTKRPLLICQPQIDYKTVSSAYEALFFQAFFDYYHKNKLDRIFELRSISAEFCLKNPHAVQGTTLFVMMESLLSVHDEKNIAVIDPQRLTFFQDQGHAIIYRSLLGDDVPGVHQVRTNIRHGIVQATRHLIQQGHTRIAMIIGSLTNIWFKPRFEGFLDELARHGIPCDPACIQTTKGFDPQQDFDAMKKLMALSPRPTAIVCANDSRALHVVEYCRNNNIDIPGELAVTGFDNTIETALSTPSITTVDQQQHLLIEAMFELAQQLPHKHRQTRTIEPLLIKRESTSHSRPPED